MSLVTMPVGATAHRIRRPWDEVHRVLRPGGQLRFYEHDIDPDPRAARVQRAIDGVHPYVGGGCHVTRDTERAIEDAGFVIGQIRRFRFAPELLSKQAAPKILGVATRSRVTACDEARTPARVTAATAL